MKNESVKKGLSPFSKIMLTMIVVMIMASFILTLLQENEIVLVYLGAYSYLPLATLASLMIWGIYGICKKIKKESFRNLIGILLGTIAVVIFVIGYVSANARTALAGSLWHEYNHENGNTVYVIQGYYVDEERYARRSADNPGRALEENDLVFSYSAYPAKCKFFMDTSNNNDCIYVAQDSKAKIRSVWNDTGTELHLSLLDAEVDDRGEITVSFSNE